MTGPEPVVAVPEGYRVGAWEVGAPLASGAFATVYAARRAHGHPAREGSVELPERAALKFLPTGTRTPRQLRYLEELTQQEIELLSRLRSPRLIRMYEVLNVDDPRRPGLDGVTVLVLEQAASSLEDLLARTPVPPSGHTVLTQVCEGLHQLHDAGWVHGDLKAANVLLMDDGSARLADFNTAAEMQGTHAYTHAFVTPDYTAPELLWPEVDERGTRIRPTADTWAFGVLAHLVLTGTHPLPGNTPQARSEAAIRYARGSEELRLSPALRPDWRDIITDCLARTHEARAAHDSSSLLRRVEQAAGGAPARRPRRRARFSRRHPVLTALAATVLLTAVVLAGAVYAYVNDDDGAPVYQALDPASAFPTGPDGEVVYGYHRCPSDSVCFFSEHNGNGEMCSWKEADSDWLAGERTCAWARDRPVRSAFNNIADARRLHDVEFFRGPDFSPTGKDRRRMAQRTGCNAVNSMGNLAGTYAPRSHRLVDSCSSRNVVWTILSIFS
ncbi:protein kinase domain-containing protein [Streptomyces sp. NRRL F-5727]|uniref:protein kinase domain-containing protein n=1 Tax=Streptomyces sp. NRRL F-5727 TaxID=1463871 RepID=UPI0004CBE14A|nr:protein kinase [Streptomyces sp. NRRL F-5727]